MALIVTPNSGQNLNQTLVPIQSNFGTINTAWNVNHVEYGVTGQGKHNLVTFPVQASDPATTMAQEAALYTKTVSGQPYLFLKNLNNGSVVNFSQFIVTAGVDTSTTLPSGIIIKCGQLTTGGGGTGIGSVTFTTPFNTILAAYATAASTTPLGHQNDQTVARIDAYSTTELTIRSLRIEAAGGSPFSTPCTWFAIGY